jgi:hypothetical protein
VRREESDRAIAHLNERAREHEERLLKEGKEAIAREIAERNRRAGWPYRFGQCQAAWGGGRLSGDQPFTSGQPPSFIGRKASAAGMVARSL